MELTERKRDLIIQLKQYQDEHGFSHKRIVDIVCEYTEQNNTDDYVSLSTVKRVFREGSEDDDSFNFDLTIRPIAVALLGAESVSHKAHDKDLSISLLRYKNERIQQLEKQLAEERELANRRVDFLKEQIAIKDGYLQKKDELITKLIEAALQHKTLD